MTDVAVGVPAAQSHELTASAEPAAPARRPRTTNEREATRARPRWLRRPVAAAALRGSVGEDDGGAGAGGGTEQAARRRDAEDDVQNAAGETVSPVQRVARPPIWRRLTRAGGEEQTRPRSVAGSRGTDHVEDDDEYTTAPSQETYGSSVQGDENLRHTAMNAGGPAQSQAARPRFVLLLGRPRHARRADRDRGGWLRSPAAVDTPRAILVSDFTLIRITALYVVVSVIATIAVLALEWHRKCDSPLRLWLIGNALCATLYFIFKYLADFMRDRLDPGPHMFCAWAHSILSCVSVAWFCVGFMFVLSAKTCRNTAPKTFCLSVVFSFFELFVLATCFLLLACICFVDNVSPNTMTEYFGVGNSTGNPTRGATRADLNRLKAVKFTKDMFPDENDNTCSICLCDYEEGENLHVLPCPGNARHAFHAACIEQWLSRDKTCPVCKHDVTEGPTPHRSNGRESTVTSSEPDTREVTGQTASTTSHGTDTSDASRPQGDARNSSSVRIDLDAEREALPRPGPGGLDAAEQRRGAEAGDSMV